MKKIRWLCIFIILILVNSCSMDDDEKMSMGSRVKQFQNDYNGRSTNIARNIHWTVGSGGNLGYWDGRFAGPGNPPTTITITIITTGSNTVTATIYAPSPSPLAVGTNTIIFTMLEDPMVGSGNWKILAISGAVSFP